MHCCNRVREMLLLVPGEQTRPTKKKESESHCSRYVIARCVSFFSLFVYIAYISVLSYLFS